MPIFQTVGASGSTGPTSGGKVTPVNTVGTTGAQVIAGNPSRVSITFHNPGTVSLYVYQMTTASGAALVPTTTVLGGTFILFSGGLLQVTGECQNAWGALSASGANNPLTIMESNV